MKKGRMYTTKKIKVISSFDFNFNVTCNSLENRLNEYAAKLNEERKEKNSEGYFLINKVEQEKDTKSLWLKNRMYRENLFLEQTLVLFYKNILIECEYPTGWEEKVKDRLEREIHYEENELTKFILED